MLDPAAGHLKASTTEADATHLDASHYMLDLPCSPAAIAGVFCPLDPDERAHWTRERVLVDVAGNLYP